MRRIMKSGRRLPQASLLARACGMQLVGFRQLCHFLTNSLLARACGSDKKYRNRQPCQNRYFSCVRAGCNAFDRACLSLANVTPRACVRDATGGQKSRTWTASGTPGRQFMFFLVIQKNEISTASGHGQGKTTILDLRDSLELRIPDDKPNSSFGFPRIHFDDHS